MRSPKILDHLEGRPPTPKFEWFNIKMTSVCQRLRYKEDLDEDSAERLLPLVMAECMADWMGKSHHGGLGNFVEIIMVE